MVGAECDIMDVDKFEFGEVGAFGMYNQENSTFWGIYKILLL